MKWMRCVAVVVAVLMMRSDVFATPVWLDVDTANGVGDVDDGLMLMQALASPEVEVVGVSTVFGNTDVSWATHVARDIVERFALGEVGVFEGAAERGGGGSTDAVRAMQAALRGGPPLTILAVGPVTNVAALIEARPDLIDNIDKVVVVAGRRPGQVFVRGAQRVETAPPDFNFELDPGAMKVLLSSGVEVVLAPWEVSSQIEVTPGDLERLRRDGGKRGAWVARTSGYWMGRAIASGKGGFHPYDSLALAHVVWPELVEGSYMRVSVDAEESGGAPSLSGTPGKKWYLHARPLDSKRKDGRELLYLHTPADGLKAELLGRLIDSGSVPVSEDGGFDLDGYAELLDGAVDWERGWVDYDVIGEREGLLDRVVGSLADVDVASLSEDEELALYLNAYNVFTLRLIMDHRPVASIFLIPADKRWEDRRWELGGRLVSLDEIEHRLVRARWDDPRIHFAFVCAAKGCPPLRPVPFEGWWLDAQLDDQSRWSHRRGHVMQYALGDRRARVTPLYAYYMHDWGDEEDVKRFAGRYHRPLYFARLLGMDVGVAFQGYDWTLNDAD